MTPEIEAFANWLGIRGYRVTATGGYAKSNGHKMAPIDVLKDYEMALMNAGAKCLVTFEDVAQFAMEHKPAEEESEPPFNLKRFILEYLDNYAVPGKKDCRWRIGKDFKTVEVMQRGIPVSSDISELMRAIRAEAINRGLGKKAKYDDIKCLVGDLALSKAAEQIESIARLLTYNPECVALADNALNRLHDFWKVRQSKEVFRTMFKHWIWQAKRKLLGLPTVWDLWLAIFGATGKGKTKFLEDFSSPFGDFALTTSISKLLDDERQMLKLTSAYVINLDELSVNNRDTPYADKEVTLGRDQQATLKALLTQKKLHSRILGGQNQTTRRLTFSCISSANEHLYDIIYDDKTMRRYFELEGTVEGDVDFSVMEEIKTHILDMWRSVDESLENGYWHPGCSVWEEVAAEQAKYYPTNTSTGRWIKDQNVVACSKDERDNLQELYDDYKTYCKERGNNPKAYTKWSVDIKHLVPGSEQDACICIRMKPEDEE